MATNPFILVELEATAPETACDSKHLASVHRVLQDIGLLKVNLKFQDPTSKYLKLLIISLHEHHGHGLPLCHSGTNGWLWDVKPTTQEVDSPSQLARSETFEPFPWHTDCSYEDDVPRYVAFQVLEHDKQGGGILSMLAVERLLDKLSPTTVDSLSRPEYQIKVPPEFTKTSITQIIGPILFDKTAQAASDSLRPSTGEKFGTRASRQHLRMRLREDLIQPMTPRGTQALQEVHSHLSNKEQRDELGVLHFTSDELPKDTIILMDNGRWLHSRSEVKDPTRHLRRVRWDSYPFTLFF